MKTNELAKRLLELKTELKEIEEEKAEIEATLKELGSMETDEFKITVSDQSREYVKGIKALFEAFDEKTVREKGLIAESNYQLLKVTLKKRKAA